jgi:hypothetical protein
LGAYERSGQNAVTLWNENVHVKVFKIERITVFYSTRIEFVFLFLPCYFLIFPKKIDSAYNNRSMLELECNRYFMLFIFAQTKNCLTQAEQKC